MNLSLKSHFCPSTIANNKLLFKICCENVDELEFSGLFFTAL